MDGSREDSAYQRLRLRAFRVIATSVTSDTMDLAYGRSNAYEITADQC